jgi:hypothetical protein
MCSEYRKTSEHYYDVKYHQSKKLLFNDAFFYLQQWFGTRFIEYGLDSVSSRFVGSGFRLCLIRIYSGSGGNKFHISSSTSEKDFQNMKNYFIFSGLETACFRIRIH